MIPSSVQNTLSSADVESLPAGFVQAQAADAEGALPVFGLQLAGEAVELVEPLLMVHALGAPVEDQAASQDLGEPNVEQWLQGMLEQQSVQLQARETPPAQAPHDNADEASQPVDGDVLLNPLPQMAQPSVAPVATAEPVRNTRTALPLATAAQSTVAPTFTPVVVPEQDSSMALLNAEPSEASDAAVDIGLLERIALPSQDGDSSAPTANSSVQNSVHNSSQAALGERTLRLQGAPAQWGEQMLQSLREHVDLQINQRIQNATIRLDPPELGSLEIYLSHESGRLNVQLSAANVDVARLLQQTSDRLRQELVGQNFVQVNVQVSADAQGGRQQGQTPRQAWAGEEQVAAASVFPTDEQRNTTDSTRDVLVTV
ncbi:flagellar hook-length control protein FliK [Pseudomonas sp. 8Z]|uniref:flagellar hook-length control protein FliK n=1 Tax=Pseudomonas sp. 8Z TaxID=2653166 RepID=UPI0013597E87|nr:flagellar hook-length control protein FliK [Pseudomonas sp. 8Z]